MDCALSIASSSICSLGENLSSTSQFNGRNSISLPKNVQNSRKNDALSCFSSARENVPKAIGNEDKQRSNLQSHFCYDTPIPEEIIEKPIGLSLAEKDIGDNPRCSICQTKGVVLCATCSGSGLYIDSILESQGIIVKVRCLGCGGTGNTMCSKCGGRGHLNC